MYFHISWEIVEEIEKISLPFKFNKIDKTEELFIGVLIKRFSFYKRVVLIVNIYSIFLLVVISKLDNFTTS